MRKALPYICAGILFAGAIAHVIVPDFFNPLIPDFVSPWLANVLATIAEAGIGILLVIPRYRHIGGLAFALLMLAFLPLHTWDLIRENPAVGPSPIPEIRFMFQFVLIYFGWSIFRQPKS